MLKHERTLIPSQVLDVAVNYFSVTNGPAYFGSVAGTIKEFYTILTYYGRLQPYQQILDLG
jgi:hypothetical protein